MLELLKLAITSISYNPYNPLNLLIIESGIGKAVSTKNFNLKV